MCTVIGDLADCLTLWCALQLDSISTRNDKHLTSLVFSVRTVSYGALFFSTLIHGPCALHLGHKLKWKKNTACNLQYGPQTRIVRGM